MVRRSERCLGLQLKIIKSNKDDPIVIKDNTEEEVRYEEPIQYEPLQTIYLDDDEQELRGPTDTLIVVYQNQKFVKTNVVFETPKAKMPKHNKEKHFKPINEGATSYDVPLNLLSESDEDIYQ
ncbi:uncharacterized protein E5676_scaffold302G00690 [Cucumis melo var. makuwa]|uniref:Uncharacterized protein n=1 Tax=Cucumis melo var. makuwa TaxID=1194695 RepID=A0A5A7TIM3_CUCMM|nr:uncharacterized protein E6C27_scaffold110G00260 [Cucumis melo var. makuwa]TYK12303.1 uncharacterized protein E5676_scaffold302G00690 [Cucumis melo var. makuwa]